MYQNPIFQFQTKIMRHKMPKQLDPQDKLSDSK